MDEEEENKIRVDRDLKRSGENERNGVQMFSQMVPTYGTEPNTAWQIC